MKIRKVNGTYVWNTSWFTFGFRARSWGWVICMPKELEYVWLGHELKHCEIMKAKPFQYFFGWLFDWRYRIWAELRAYNISHPSDHTYVSGVLHRSYGIPKILSLEQYKHLTLVCCSSNFKFSKKVIES